MKTTILIICIFATLQIFTACDTTGVNFGLSYTDEKGRTIGGSFGTQQLPSTKGLKKASPDIKLPQLAGLKK